MQRDANGLEVLTDDECFALLAKHTFGRIAVSSAALPVVLPVNYALVDDQIVIRTRRTTKIAAATRDSVVAFEVDDIDPATGSGWSVLVQGIARQVDDYRVVDDHLLTALAQWIDPTDRFLVTISVDVISGRRLHVG